MKEIQSDGFQSSDFQLDIEECRFLVAPEDIAKKRQCQLLGRATSNLKSPELGVVADHGLTIGGEPNVEFEAVASLREREIE